MEVEVYENINHPKLEADWKLLQKITKAFPQMHYEWVRPWWESNKNNKKLYVVAVYDEKSNILGLAPFCIHKQIGIKVLRNIPIHFGDFYSILATTEEAESVIIEHIIQCEGFNAIHLFNCNDRSQTYAALRKCPFKEKKIVKILSPSFEQLDFTSFQKTISKNSRSQYRKKLKRLKREGEVTLLEIKDWERYQTYFSETKRLYDIRWKGDKRPLLSDAYYKMRNTALKPIFDKGCAALYLITLDDEVIAFRLGFFHHKVFYDWKTAHDPGYNYYSPGFLSIGLIIEKLIENGFIGFNFMTGNYRYKRSWTNNEDYTYNYELLYSDDTLLGNLFVNYRLEYRDQLKQWAEKLNLR